MSDSQILLNQLIYYKLIVEILFINLTFGYDKAYYLINFKKHFMKPKYFLALLVVFELVSVTAQRSFEERFSSIQQELTTWDPVRGSWLSSSLFNFSKNEPVPDRTFPEDFTPYEMVKTLPSDLRNRIVDTVQSNSTRFPDEASQWNAMQSIISRSGCSYISGRTYGDPHLTSFDGANYSFQTVGEFTLVKSTKSNLEIQCRQRPQNDNFSLNTAVAMNVAGDRVAIYAENKPDFDSSPLRVNGAPVQLSGRTYFLSRGGNIRLTGRNYIITYPTGEIVNVEMRQSGAMQFLNILVQVFDCDRSNFQGLLGNANNNVNDDFNGNNNRSSAITYTSVFGNSSISKHAEKEYLAFLAGSFADEWRVNQTTSLFDYGIGQSTLTFTDRSFPRVHYTIDDLTPEQTATARRNCEDRGILANDLRGCIYDQGFLNIEPNRIPSNPDFTQGIDLKPVLKPALHTNNFQFSDGKTPTGNNAPLRPGKDDVKGDSPLNKQLNNELPKNPNSIPNEKPNKEPVRGNSNPINVLPKVNTNTPKESTPKPASLPATRGIKGKN